MPDGTTVVLQYLKGDMCVLNGGVYINGLPVLQKRKAYSRARAEQIRATFKSETDNFVGTENTNDTAKAFGDAMIIAAEFLRTHGRRRCG